MRAEIAGSLNVSHIKKEKAKSKTLNPNKPIEKETINNNVEPINIPKQEFSFQSQSLPPRPNNTILELMKRMNGQVKTLLEEQLEIDCKIVANEVIASDIASKLSNLCGDKEVAKLNLHIIEIESVHNLILGLTTRLAKVEVKNLETNGEAILLERKRDKLMEQLSEAKWIRKNIDRRSKKVIICEYLYLF